MPQVFASVADRDRIVQEMPWEARDWPRSIHAALARVAAAHGARPALSFQMFSAPGSPATTLTWAQLTAEATRAANLFRGLGVGAGDVVALMLPNCPEMVIAMLGAAMAGVVMPINPLLEPTQIAGILRESGAKVLVTLGAFPKTDMAQKAAAALEAAPDVTTVLEVDLARHLTGVKRWLVPFARPRVAPGRRAVTRRDFRRACRTMAPVPGFADATDDRIAACFHTGGTTGAPRLVWHRLSGMLYNGWIGSHLLFTERDVMICPLPLFHVFAAYPVLMSALLSGAHLVLPTPAGFRGEGVMENFWKLVEYWKVSFMIAVPAAIVALTRKAPEADLTSLRCVISGSAPLPVEINRRFRAATGLDVAEGYGLTEASCLIAVNPIDGPKKTGSAGLPMPYAEVKILEIGTLTECPPGTVGEICVSSPGVVPEAAHAGTGDGPFGGKAWLRTGDLGRIDADGYLWITGRAKDLIIRGGHNIDPAMIETAMTMHPAVAFAAAIGQPDAAVGELPCVYVELAAGTSATVAELADYARTHVPERAALPKHIEILPELPKTGVGKIFKPDLRRRAIVRVLDAALADTGARVTVVRDDPARGLVAVIEGGTDRARVAQTLGEYPVAWDWAAS